MFTLKPLELLETKMIDLLFFKKRKFLKKGSFYGCLLFKLNKIPGRKN